jgi:hypothetical protein
LTRILTILSFILLAASASQAQSRTSTTPDPGTEKIIKFYPNPATSIINFDIQKGYERGYDLQIYNLLGKLVYEQKNVSQKTTISLTDFNRGMYVFQYIDANRRIVESGKFQVSK